MQTFVMQNFTDDQTTELTPTPFRRFGEADRTETEKSEFKMVFCGDGGVGKTTMVKRMLTNGPFDPRYTPTLGVEVYPILHNESSYSVWDCAGQKKFGGLVDGYFLGADHVAIVYSCNPNTQKNLSLDYWVEIARRASPGAKISLVGNGTSNMYVSESVYKFCLDRPEIRHVRVDAKTMTGGQLRLNLLGTH